MGVHSLAKTLLLKKRRVFFRSKPIFQPYAPVSLEQIVMLEKKIGTSIPIYLSDWLLMTGYGDIDDELSFREEWFMPIERGTLKGGGIFAQDILGNFYAFDLFGHIYFLSRDEPSFSILSEDFLAFIKELTYRNYKLNDWVITLNTQQYDW